MLGHASRKPSATSRAQGADVQKIAGTVPDRQSGRGFH
jgi:hypothetical protein